MLSLLHLQERYFLSGLAAVWPTHRNKLWPTAPNILMEGCEQVVFSAQFLFDIEVQSQTPGVLQMLRDHIQFFLHKNIEYFDGLESGYHTASHLLTAFLRMVCGDWHMHETFSKEKNVDKHDRKTPAWQFSNWVTDEHGPNRAYSKFGMFSRIVLQAMTNLPYDAHESFCQWFIDVMEGCKLTGHCGRLSISNIIDAVEYGADYAAVAETAVFYMFQV